MRQRIDSAEISQRELRGRAIYRRWVRGIIFFYCGLLFIAGVAAVNYSVTGRTELTKLSVNQAARAD